MNLLNCIMHQNVVALVYFNYSSSNLIVIKSRFIILLLIRITIVLFYACVFCDEFRALCEVMLGINRFKPPMCFMYRYKAVTIEIIMWMVCMFCNLFVFSFSDYCRAKDEFKPVQTNVLHLTFRGDDPSFIMLYV